MGYFDNSIRDLYYNVGILDILLPFILVFTLVYSVLQKTKVLGETNGRPNKNFNVVISVVLATATVFPHVLWGTNTPRLSNGMPDVVHIINSALPQVSLIIVAILMFMIVIGIWGKQVKFAGGSLASFITIFSILAIVYIFATSAGWLGRMPDWLRFLDDPQTRSLIVVILVFGLIIRFITGDDKGNGDKDSFFKKMSKFADNNFEDVK